MKYHLITGTVNDRWSDDFRELATFAKSIAVGFCAYAVIVDNTGRLVYSKAYRGATCYGEFPAQLQDSNGVWHCWDSPRGIELAQEGTP